MSTSSHPSLLHGPVVILTLAVRLFDLYLSSSEAVGSEGQESGRRHGPSLGTLHPHGLAVPGHETLAGCSAFAPLLINVFWPPQVAGAPVSSRWSCPTPSGNVLSHLRPPSPSFDGAPVSREYIAFCPHTDGQPAQGRQIFPSCLLLCLAHAWMEGDQ